MRHYDLAPIAEVAMNPAAFAQSLEQAGGRKVLVGMEFEVLVPKDIVEKNQAAGSSFPAWHEMIEDVTWADSIGMDKLSLTHNDFFETINRLVTTGRGGKLTTVYKKWNQQQFKPIIDPMVNEFFNKIRNPSVRSIFVEGYELLMEAWQRSRSINYDYLEYNAIVEEILIKTRAKAQVHFRSADPEDQIAFRQAAHEIGLLALRLSNLYNHTQLINLYQKFYNELAGTTVNNLGDLLRSGAVQFDMGNRTHTEIQNLKSLWHRAQGLPPPRQDAMHPDNQGAQGIHYQTRVFLQSQLKPMFGDVIVFDRYHQTAKNMTSWYVEPDGSLHPNPDDGCAEVVSPPMPAGAAIEALKDFYRLAIRNEFYTNYSTGLHINVSIPDQTDLLKLLVFLGDEYVLKSFNRIDNDYAQSIVRSTIRALRDEFEAGLPRLGPSFTEIVEEVVSDLTGEHFSSITYNGTYFSFRHAGGDYLNNLKSVLDTVGRFVRALIIASSPDQYQKEYLTKLYKLRDQSIDDTEDISPIEKARQQIRALNAEGAQVARVYFLKLNYGNISMDDFKKRIKVMYPGFTITFAPATDQDVKGFTARGHGLSTNTKQFAQANPQNLLVATAAVPGSINSASSASTVRRYLDLTDEQAGSFDASDGYTKLGVFWGTKAARIDPNTPEMRQMIKDIVKNLKTKSKKK